MPLNMRIQNVLGKLLVMYIIFFFLLNLFLLIHIFSCEVCNKSFTTSIGLGNHNIRYHALEEDLIHACDQCPKKFARKNILELHKISHIPKEKWQYFCNVCPNKRA